MQLNSSAPAGAAAAEDGGLLFQDAPQILVRRVGIPDVELQRLAHVDLAADRDGARFGLRAEDAADQEIALTPLGPVFVHYYPDLDALGEEFPVPYGKRRGQFLQARHGRAPA